MELKEKIDRQIQLAAREVVIRFSRDEVPDSASLALALASGETAATLAEKVKAKIDRRTATPAVTSEPLVIGDVVIPPVEAVVDEVKDEAKEEVTHRPRSHHKK